MAKDNISLSTCNLLKFLLALPEREDIEITKWEVGGKRLGVVWVGGLENFARHTLKRLMDF